MDGITCNRIKFIYESNPLLDPHTHNDPRSTGQHKFWGQRSKKRSSRRGARETQ